MINRSGGLLLPSRLRALAISVLNPLALPGRSGTAASPGSPSTASGSIVEIRERVKSRVRCSWQIPVNTLSIGAGRSHQELLVLILLVVATPAQGQSLDPLTPRPSRMLVLAESHYQVLAGEGAKIVAPDETLEFLRS